MTEEEFESLRLLVGGWKFPSRPGASSQSEDGITTVYDVDGVAILSCSDADYADLQEWSAQKDPS